MVLVRSSLSSLIGTALVPALLSCSDDLGVEPVPPGSRVVISPTTATLAVSDSLVESLQFRAIALSYIGDTIADQKFVWSSSDTSVAVVDPAGLVVARAPGTAVITADAGEKARATVTVRYATEQLIVTPGAQQVVAGDTLGASAIALDPLGAAVPGVSYQFTSSNTTVATMDSVVRRPLPWASGVMAPYAFLTPRAAGIATITVSANGHQQSFDVTVLPRVVTSVEVGRDFGCGVMPDGRIACWGLGEARQLAAEADSVCYGDSSDPVNTQGCALRPLPSDTAVAFRAVSAGRSFACGVSTVSRLWCWGADTVGQLGRGRVNDEGRVGPATVYTTQTFTSVSAGDQHACAVATTSVVYCWGADSTGQLGDYRKANSTTPIPVANLQGVTVVSAGGEHSCAIAGGTAYCWGSNERGQLGAPSADTCVLPFRGALPCSEIPVPITGQTFTTVTAGRRHSCALTAAGAAYCWGDNSAAQLGTGSVGGSASTPQSVAGGFTFTAISAGDDFSCAITTGGAAYCWGSSGYWQTGDNQSGGTRSSPAAVSGGLSYASISAGRRHACGATSAGVVYCWGSNMYGALGNELQAAMRYLPQLVAEVGIVRK